MTLYAVNFNQLAFTFDLRTLILRTKGDLPMQTETLIFGAGCFWGAQELIRKVPGVIETEVGYTGGHLKSPGYKDVSTGETGHVEAVRVTYDPKVISRQKLLELFFKLHDPTTKDRQGNDVGSQYRSVIFYKSPEEKEIAQEAITKAQAHWENPIVTRLEEEGPFYSAEEEHQDYLQKNPYGYTCHYWRD